MLDNQHVIGYNYRVVKQRPLAGLVGESRNTFFVCSG